MGLAGETYRQTDRKEVSDAKGEWCRHSKKRDNYKNLVGRKIMAKYILLS